MSAPAPDWLLEDMLAPDVLGDPLQPLYDAAATGDLALPFCTHCGLPLDLDQRACDACGSRAQQWLVVEPRGTVHSATLVHRLEPGLVRTERPYPIADVELDGGHRLLLAARDPSTAAPAIGSRVEIGFRHLGSVTLPAFVSSTRPPSPA